MRIQPISNIVYVKKVGPQTDINTLYKRQKKLIERRISLIKRNDLLSESEKSRQIGALEKHLQNIEYKIVNKPLQQFADQGQKIINNLDASVVAPSEEKLRKTASLIEYGLINSNTQAKIMDNLSSARTLASLDYEENSSKISRIDGFLDDSGRSSSISREITNKAIGTYAQIEEAILEKQAEKAVKEGMAKEKDQVRQNEKNQKKAEFYQLDDKMDNLNTMTGRKEESSLEFNNSNIARELDLQQDISFQNQVVQDTPFFK